MPSSSALNGLFLDRCHQAFVTASYIQVLKKNLGWLAYLPEQKWASSP
jgi:hypothetical protein